MASVSNKLNSSENLEDPIRNETPLCGLDVYKEEQFYNVNSNIFAEPVEYLNNDIKPQSSQFKFYDPITVETNAKYRKKYHIPIEDPFKAI